MESQNEAFLTALAAMIICVAKESPALTELNLADNKFCGGELAQILSDIRSNDQAKTSLVMIHLNGAKWDTD